MEALVTRCNKRIFGRLSAVAVVGCLALSSTPAPAQTTGQAVKPYVMLLFDTSGSMIWPICISSYATINGDNSTECRGNDVACSTCNYSGCSNGQGDDSRLYKVKRGAHSVVNAFGEVTFGLSRFHNVPADFTCNAYFDGRAGGWKGVNCGGSLGTGGNSADILEGFSSNNANEVLSWMNNCDDYPTPGACPQVLAPRNGCNLCPDCGSGCDKELRGVGSTPLAGSLFAVRRYFNSTVLPGDSKSACRPYKVILLTDGQESCGGNPSSEAQKLFTNAGKSIEVHVVGFGNSSLKRNLDAIAKAGGTGSAVVVDNEVSLALAMANIISGSILNEKCNGKDDDCDGTCDETWTEVGITASGCTDKRAAKACTAGVGICQRGGIYVCKPDGSGSECSAKAGSPSKEVCNGLDDNCNGQVDEGNVCGTCVPQPEICDGKDNNCNGQVDEGYRSMPCGSNIGECTAGVTACVGGKVLCQGATGPTPEKCDGLDNNCDGVVDKLSESCYPPTTGCDLSTGKCQGRCSIGVSICTKGKWGSCVGYTGPKTEVCNGLDDDCNGKVDEGVGNTCTNYTTCKQYVSCSSCLYKPTEICDNKDNDCNGKIDDNVPGVGTSCGTAIGACTNGTWKCLAGKMTCSGGSAASKEVCNNKDDDCNGKIDDNVPGAGQPCGSSKGECKQGVTKCIKGKFVCQGEVKATAEVCDCKDNNCNGQVDEGAKCPNGAKCMNCKCVVPCSGGEFVCPGGTKCKNGYCVPDACAKITCKTTEFCRDGKCISKCLGISCKSTEKCDPNTGLCVDNTCLTKGCPKGQTCINYKCVADPCPPGKCPSGQVCKNGKCYSLCANVTCGANEICIDGKCVTKKLCDIKKCPENHVCREVNGQAKCEPDPCSIISCKQGSVCINGTCVIDPCSTTRCPAGFSCRLNTRNQPECISGGAVPTTRQMVTSGGGGFCSVGAGDDDPPATPFLVLLAAVWFRLRRRTRGEG